MNARQKRFCDEYLIDCNATQAAIRAGYSAKTAYAIGEENLRKPELRQYIDNELERLHNERTANAEEVMEYLTAVMRCEADNGEEISTRDRLRAAELIGKRYGLFKDNVELTGTVPVVIAGEDSLEN